MSSRSKPGGAQGLRPLSGLLGRGSSAWAATWSLVVGERLAKVSICLGPTPEQVLRVMVRNEPDRLEFMERSASILDSWNIWAERHEGPPASSFVCWVRAAAAPLPQVRPPGEAAPVEDRWIRAAEEKVPAMADSHVRSAIVRARARDLRSQDRAISKKKDE